MNKKILLGIFAIAISCGMKAQTAVTDPGDKGSIKPIYEKSINEARKINYPYLREADVVWSRYVYRLIDLREKINQALYYPISPYTRWQAEFYQYPS